MADRRDLAVRRRADADALDRRRAVRRVVEHQRRCQGHLDRAPAARARHGGQDGVGADEELAAKAAADVRRTMRTFSGGMPSVLAMSRNPS
jgi:hypothetical protein